MIRAYPALDGLSYEFTEEEQTYVPQPGDYVYFRWKNAADTVNVSHVGIVAAVTSNHTITWEGNVSKKVVQRTYSLHDAQILGYGRPQYCEHSETPL